MIITCVSCRSKFTKLYAVKSSLEVGMTLTLCDNCNTMGYEPRWLVIMYGRKHGFNSVVKFISANKYLGNPILASELA